MGGVPHNASGEIKVENFPAALTAGGNLKVAVQEALPTGSNHLGSVMATNAAGVVPTFSTANTPGSPAALPNSTSVYSILRAREPTGSMGYFVPCDTSGRLFVVSHPAAPTTTSHSAAAEEQRGIDFAFSLYDLTVTSDLAGYILLVNKASDAAAADAPLGAHTYPIQANSSLVIGGNDLAPIAFSLGLQVVFSTTKDSVTLPGVAHIRASIRGV